MTKTNVFLVVLLLAVAAGAVVLFTRDTDTGAPYSDLIRVTNPREGDTVENPLVVSGEARGNWFFEASFPVRIIGEDGRELAVVPAQAQGEWMTEAFVPFKATLVFTVSEQQNGFVVFEKDNPSGLPENAAEVRVPVVLMPSGETTTLKVFFGRDDAPEGEECTTVAAVPRSVPKTTAVARTALEELLKGPTEEEKTGGFFTSINLGVVIQSLTITDGVARVDFSGALEEQVGGSCHVTHIRRQITETLLQFPTVKSVIISIDGKTEDILQP